MMEMLENRMLEDSEWGQVEYGVPDARRLKRFMEEYEEESEESEDEFI